MPRLNNIIRCLLLYALLIGITACAGVSGGESSGDSGDQTAQQVAAESTPDAAPPAPQLIAPADGEALPDSSNVRLAWQWVRPLNPDEYYDLRVWRDGEPAYGITWTQVSSFDLSAWLNDQPEGGLFFWQVAVIAGRDGQVEKFVSHALRSKLLTCVHVMP